MFYKKMIKSFFRKNKIIFKYYYFSFFQLNTLQGKFLRNKILSTHNKNKCG